MGLLPRKADDHDDGYVPGELLATLGINARQTTIRKIIVNKKI